MIIYGKIVEKDMNAQPIKIMTFPKWDLSHPVIIYEKRLWLEIKAKKIINRWEESL